MKNKKHRVKAVLSRHNVFGDDTSSQHGNNYYHLFELHISRAQSQMGFGNEPKLHHTNQTVDDILEKVVIHIIK